MDYEFFCPYCEKLNNVESSNPNYPEYNGELECCWCNKKSLAKSSCLHIFAISKEEKRGEE